jgi:hypothetical protein
MVKFTSSTTAGLQSQGCVYGEFPVVGSSRVVLRGVRAGIPAPEGLVRCNCAPARLRRNGGRSTPAWPRRSDAAAWLLTAGGFSQPRLEEA